MPYLVAQSGLFIVSIAAMYAMYGLPTFAAISLIAAIVAGRRRKDGPKPTLDDYAALFMKVFGRLAIFGAVVVMVAMIWAARSL
jgi:hypothetical protein